MEPLPWFMIISGITRGSKHGIDSSGIPAPNYRELDEHF